MSRTQRELAALQRQMIVHRGPDYLLPSERGWRQVWSGFRWRELWTALAAVVWLTLVWLCLRYGPLPGGGERGQGGGQAAREQVVGGHAPMVGQGGGGAK